MKTTLLIRISLLSLSIFMMGFIVKSMHWPGGHFTFIIGGSSFMWSLMMLALTIDLKKIAKIINHMDEEVENNNFKKQFEEVVADDDLLKK